MATVVNVTKNGKAQCSNLISGIQQMKAGVDSLQAQFHTMAEVLGAGGAEGQAALQAVYGFDTPAEAQAFYDRLNDFNTRMNDMANTEFAKVRDLIYPFVS